MKKLDSLVKPENDVFWRGIFFETKMHKTIVVLITGEGFRDIEAEAVRRIRKRLLQDCKSLTLLENEKDHHLKVKDILHYDCDAFVVIKGNLFITCEGVIMLSDMVISKGEFPLIVPVSNETMVSQQRCIPPFIYQNITMFKNVCISIYEQYRNDVAETNEIDDFCFAFGRRLLDSIPEDLLIGDLPDFIKKRRLGFAIARGIYVHRYGNVYESSREDLLKYVPESAIDVLDIGCARGLSGELLKKRQQCRVTGIDMDEGLLSAAGQRLDRIIRGDIEEVVEKGSLGIYDCILCGDILEHLNDPWRVVEALRKHLKTGGVFIVSTPNIANWGVLYEMLKGRWDYVPFTILSGTHIRFFTRQTLIELFENAGYKIKEISFQGFELPTEGAEFIRNLKKVMNEINEEELKASEIVVVAEA